MITTKRAKSAGADAPLAENTNCIKKYEIIIFLVALCEKSL